MLSIAFLPGCFVGRGKWFQQTIALDPKRSVAYLNLGDAYWQLQDKPEAADAYKKFLAIAPTSKAAPGVQEKLKALESKP